MNVTHEVKPIPSPEAHPKPRSYTKAQEEAIQALKQHAETLILPETDPYYTREVAWLQDPELAARYMRASKWKLEEAKKRIQSTMEWRRETKPDLISADEVEVENETGKIILNGYDNECRPIITMRPGRQNTKTSDRQIQHLIFCLERAIDYMVPGQDSMVILVDYKSASLRTNPSISTASKVLTILQQHYPERLGRAIVTNLPTLLTFFYKGIQPFLDPVTREKMRFNPDLPSLIPLDHLDAEFGGNFHYEFDHKSYWTQIMRHCGINSDGTRYTPYPVANDTDSHAATSTISSPASSDTPDLIQDDDESKSSQPPSPAPTAVAQIAPDHGGDKLSEGPRDIRMAAQEV
ncbi:hypothetical protein FRC03_010166 [Tulasnella sp. 419]|nr:hypothetical protein FRC02_008903 [Tulasnella sp. 418]KAG8967321.1 hypothetical protein FRC03_010166 [Tulasnella sp. 419]